MKHIASILRLTIFFLMASTIGGCQLGKHYTRPQIEMPEVLDSLSMDSTSMGDFPWEELYTDTTLQALIRKTLEYNKDMLIAGARIKELAAMKRIDRLGQHVSSYNQQDLRRRGRGELWWKQP